MSERRSEAALLEQISSSYSWTWNRQQKKKHSSGVRETRKNLHQPEVMLVPLSVSDIVRAPKPCWIKANELDKRFEHENIDEFLSSSSAWNDSVSRVSKRLGVFSRVGDGFSHSSFVNMKYASSVRALATQGFGEKIDIGWKFTRHAKAEAEKGSPIIAIPLWRFRADGKCFN